MWKYIVIYTLIQLRLISPQASTDMYGRRVYTVTPFSNMRWTEVTSTQKKEFTDRDEALQFISGYRDFSDVQLGYPVDRCINFVLDSTYVKPEELEGKDER